MQNADAAGAASILNSEFCIFMPPGHRPDRVGEEIRHELSDLLSRGAVHDPGIGFITLTRVKVSPDLQIARVFYTSMGDDAARRETSQALERATPFLRRQIGGRLRLRRVPELEFRFDESIANQDRIEQILRELHEEDAHRVTPASEDSSSTAGHSGSDDPGYTDDDRDR
jgi:ribosome-binding factor A